jgi:hypothetical protein
MNRIEQLFRSYKARIDGESTRIRWGKEEFYDGQVACAMGLLAMSEAELFGEEKVQVPSTVSPRITTLGHLQTLRGYTTVWTSESKQVVRVLAGVIREQFPERVEELYLCEPSTYVTCFNDHDDTTLADVRLVVDKAEAELFGGVSP